MHPAGAEGGKCVHPEFFRENCEHAGCTTYKIMHLALESYVQGALLISNTVHGSLWLFLEKAQTGYYSPAPLLIALSL